MKKFYLTALVILFICNISYCQWVQMPGPRGMKINVFYKNDNIVYAGTKSYGVYRSINNGANWEPANTGIEHSDIFDIIFSGNNLLAGVGNSCGLNNVYKSTDNGMHWIPTSGLANKIALSFAIKGTYIYTATTDFNSSIYRSADNGESWQTVESPITDANEVFVSGNAVIVSEFNFIWRTTDDGDSWELAEKFALSGVTQFAKSGNKIFGAGGSGLYTSVNNGESWTYSNFPGGASSLSAVGNIIYLGSSKVSKSTDAGATWNLASTNLGKGKFETLLYDGVNVYAGTNSDNTSGVYITTNGGGSWYPSSNGFPPGSTIRSMISLGNYVFAGMQSDGIYRSSDDGVGWSKVGLNNDSLSSQFVECFCIKNGVLYAGASNGVYKSTDNGLTFTRMVVGFPGGGSTSIPSLTVSNGNIIASGYITYTSTRIVEIYYSTNDGTSWNQSSFPAISNLISSIVSEGGSLVYAGSFGNSFSTTGLYKSTNAGVTWISMTSSINADIEILAVKGLNVLAGNLFAAFFSLDGGETFGSSSPPGGGIFTYTLKDNFVFAGNQEGMYYSTNKGITWNDANTGFVDCPRPDVEASCANQRYLYAGTGLTGIWRRPLSDFGITGIIKNDPSLPSKYDLLQNYPNPFNPVTHINFSIPEESKVSLKIYNSIGKEINTLVNEIKKPGNYSVTFNATNLSSGIYFYKLSSGNFIQTKRMILLK